MELTPEDKQRIEQEAKVYAKNHSAAPDKETPDWIITDFMRGAEYATIYEREKQIKTLSRPGSKYYVSYDPDYKDKVFGVFNKEDLTQQGAEKMAQQLNNLETERTELRNKLLERLEKIDSPGFDVQFDGEFNFLSNLLNSLKK